MKKIKNFIFKNKVELIIFLFAFFFSWWLMFSTFSYSSGEIKIASKAWSDFASHIPLIRSFSFGYNLPPQYPLFPGEPIRYHFLFYAFAGFLEKIGLKLDFALNIPSVIGFTLLIIMIYIFAKELFKSKTIGVLSVIFFLFNGSLSFIRFFMEHPISKNVFLDIFQNNKFSSFGPYDGSIISAFWNLNIYTNQRHLAISYSLSLFIIYLFLKLNVKEKKENIKKSIFIGIVLGLSFILNMAVFLMTFVVLFSMSLFFKNKRFLIFLSLLVAFLVALPQYVFTQPEISSFKPVIHLGYLITNLNFVNFLNYWFLNLGLHFILIPIVFVFVNKDLRKILASFLSLFIIGNIFQFSPEIAANHKFFNLFMIVGSIFSAYIIYYLWKKIFIRPLILLTFLLLILSGIIDFFPVYNDYKISLPDYPINKDVNWVMKNTKKDSIFLNNNYLYTGASLAGRKIFLGWPYFAWSQGYDTNSRDSLRKDLFLATDLKTFCKNSFENKLSYVEIYDNSDIPINKSFFESNFINIYNNYNSRYTIYDINKTCK